VNLKKNVGALAFAVAAPQARAYQNGIVASGTPAVSSTKIVGYEQDRSFCSSEHCVPALAERVDPPVWR
jgi:hypothetical protein